MHRLAVTAMRKRSAGYFRRLARKLRREFARTPPGLDNSRTERALRSDALRRMNEGRHQGGRRCAWRW
jgi:hypothetical protein